MIMKSKMNLINCKNFRIIKIKINRYNKVQVNIIII